MDDVRADEIQKAMSKYEKLRATRDTFSRAVSKIDSMLEQMHGIGMLCIRTEPAGIFYLTPIEANGLRTRNICNTDEADAGMLMKIVLQSARDKLSENVERAIAAMDAIEI